MYEGIALVKSDENGTPDVTLFIERDDVLLWENMRRGLIGVDTLLEVIRLRRARTLGYNR